MNIDIIAKVIIPILGAIITYLIVPFIKQKTTKEQRGNIYNLVKIAVQAAEQMRDAGLINIPKKEYVIDYLNSKGINIGIQDLEVMIESAVQELYLAKKALE
ncbi:Bacteriophage holin of superfamily 6 (Holin_LLH) [Lutispora thermophila DSM 19022]|uniref:Bacteriophage holin of superfamily 6 (Holin_LLH) n=2 Tax=Lutispora TaxID=667112 RepID=A0A1M6CR28_9FIRM|nr:Bacteriophage holin of superfamily 6 (Holin_LLH) [Lutispora thermophila DSM 19022]